MKKLYLLCIALLSLLMAACASQPTAETAAQAGPSDKPIVSVYLSPT
jgi:outer membrane lipoprotein-sorting protein